MIYADCCEDGRRRCYVEDQLDESFWALDTEEGSYVPISYCPFCGRKLGGETLEELEDRFAKEGILEIARGLDLGKVKKTRKPKSYKESK